MRIHDTSKCGAGLANFVDEIATTRGGPADQVGVSAQVLRAGVQHDIDSELRRARVDRSGKRAVNQRGQPVLTCERRRLTKVDNSERRICRRFQVKQLCVLANGSRVLIVVRSVDESGLNPHFWRPSRKKLSHPAV